VLGFGVERWGLRVLGSRFRVKGLGFRIFGLKKLGGNSGT
jgi:hypothetical protein